VQGWIGNGRPLHDPVWGLGLLTAADSSMSLFNHHARMNSTPASNGGTLIHFVTTLIVSGGVLRFEISDY
jgi:hypothetical protein